MIFKRLSFYLAITGIAASAYLVNILRSAPPPPPPDKEPARSPFTNSVAASGLVEAARENVRIATQRAGLVTKVFVKVGDTVKERAPLFQLDDRDTRARLASARAQVAALQAALRADEVMLADAEDQWQRVEKLSKENVASDDELKRKRFQRDNWTARLAKDRADIDSSSAAVQQAEVDLELLTVRAPRDGTVLQVNTRDGEHAALAPAEPLMILGETDVLQIRADVDEQNAPLVRADQPAVAYLKGDTKSPIRLQFVRIDPFVIPKRSLTGDSVERVDTRVLQIIFQFDRKEVGVPVYVGQQVDVFIQRPMETRAGK
ncbi:MAG: efflux RND transporter periplasmic adaptor subunit [Verrucomicrobia bacterium]|nr:efflux RND transporter periplasmic adaptor subunit [Verrucomicrobiota bacterium]